MDSLLLLAVIVGLLILWFWLMGRNFHSKSFLAIFAVVVFALASASVFTYFLGKESPDSDDSFSTPEAATLCSEESMKVQQEELRRTYIDKIGRDIVVCREQIGVHYFLTKNGVTPLFSVSKQFHNDYGHLMPGESEERRLARFIQISRGSIPEAWRFRPKTKPYQGEVAPFIAQDLDYVIFHVRVP